MRSIIDARRIPKSGEESRQKYFWLPGLAGSQANKLEFEPRTRVFFCIRATLENEKRQRDQRCVTGWWLAPKGKWEPWDMTRWTREAWCESTRCLALFPLERRLRSKFDAFRECLLWMDFIHFYVASFAQDDRKERIESVLVTYTRKLFFIAVYLHGRFTNFKVFCTGNSPLTAASSSIWNFRALALLENLSVCHMSSFRPCPATRACNQKCCIRYKNLTV